MIIDTHAHLDDEQYEEDRESVINRAADEGVEMIINMGADIASSYKAVKLALSHDIIYAAVGIHPEEAEGMLEKDKYILSELVSDNEKVLAIGEIGLDYHFRTDNKEIQKKVFIEQLDIARQMHVPVSIHARDAHGDLMQILKKEGRGMQGVIHCYSGSVEMAKELFRMGWYIGADGPLTFKNSAKLPEVIKMMPLERLLIETDSPYLTPPPYLGKRNDPSNVLLVAEELARIKNMDVQELIDITRENAMKIYQIHQ